MVCSGMIQNCHVTPKAVINANIIFGPGVASLKGKATRKTSNPVVTEYVEILQEILDMNKKVTLEVYVMFVNGLSFFVISSGIIKFTTLEYIPKRTNGVCV